MEENNMNQNCGEDSDGTEQNRFDNNGQPIEGYQSGSCANSGQPNEGYQSGGYTNAGQPNDNYQSSGYQNGSYPGNGYQNSGYQNYYQPYNSTPPYQNGQLELEEPVKISEWVLSLVLMMIPCVNIIMMFVWAFGSTEKKSKSNFFKAYLIFFAISMALVVLTWFAIVFFVAIALS